METSPAAEKVWGTADSIWVSATLKTVLESSVIWKRLVAVPPEPILIRTRSVRAVAEVGLQSILNRLPFVVKASEVEVIFKPLPEERPSTEISRALAVVRVSATRLKTLAFI